MIDYFFLDQYKKKAIFFCKKLIFFLYTIGIGAKFKVTPSFDERTNSREADRTHDVPTSAAAYALTLPDYLLIACKELGSVKRQFIEVKHKITS